MHPEDAWRDRFCVLVLPERVWRKSLFRVISRAFHYTGIVSLPEEQGLQCLETPDSWELARVSLCHGRAIGASCLVTVLLKASGDIFHALIMRAYLYIPVYVPYLAMASGLILGIRSND